MPISTPVTAAELIGAVLTADPATRQQVYAALVAQDGGLMHRIFRSARPDLAGAAPAAEDRPRVLGSADVTTDPSDPEKPSLA